MAKQIAIGIDLGTTNSAVGVWHHERVELVENNEGLRITPSCVYYSSEENYFGRMAVNKCITDPQNVFFDAKRLLAETINSHKVQEFKNSWQFTVVGYPDPTNGKVHFLSIHGEEKIPISPEKVSTDILKFLLNSVCRRLEVTEDDIEAVITVPAYFNITQKRATLEAAQAAGIKVKRLLSEPVAAALCYQMDINQDNRFREGNIVLVFDFGGGTLDVTIMKVEEGIYKVIALGGDSHLGGRDFDLLIANMINGRLRRQLGDKRVSELLSKPKYQYRLMKVARDVKESLSITESEVLSLSNIYLEANDEEITRKEFEEKSQHLRNKVVKCCENTLQDTGIDPNNINYVICVGGASKMVAVQDILKTKFPSSVIFKHVLSADEAIAKGATIYAARLLNASDSPVIKNINIQDALPLSIGVEVAGNKFEPILKKNSPIPSANTIKLRTSENYQQRATIPIYEGLSEDITKDTYIGEIEITGIPPRKAGEIPVVVTLELDMNGILQATAAIPEMNITVETKIDYEITFKMQYDKQNSSESHCYLEGLS